MFFSGYNEHFIKFKANEYSLFLMGSVVFMGEMGFILVSSILEISRMEMLVFLRVHLLAGYHSYNYGSKWRARAMMSDFCRGAHEPTKAQNQASRKLMKYSTLADAVFSDVSGSSEGLAEVPPSRTLSSSSTRIYVICFKLKPCLYSNFICNVICKSIAEYRLSVNSCSVRRAWLLCFGSTQMTS